MAQRVNMARTSIQRLQDIDFAAISKLVKSLNIPPRQWDKIMAMPEYKKREVELVKYILKSSLPKKDGITFKLREQKHGGFSMTIVGELAKEWINYLRSEKLNELRLFYAQTNRAAEFEEVYTAFIENQATFVAQRGYLLVKTDSLYSRLIPGYWGTTGYRTERDEHFDLLYYKITWLLWYVISMVELAEKLIQFREELNVENITVIELRNSIPVENLVSYPAEHVFRELASIF